MYTLTLIHHIPYLLDFILPHAFKDNSLTSNCRIKINLDNRKQIGQVHRCRKILPVVPL